MAAEWLRSRGSYWRRRKTVWSIWYVEFIVWNFRWCAYWMIVKWPSTVRCTSTMRSLIVVNLIIRVRFTIPICSTILNRCKCWCVTNWTSTRLSVVVRWSVWWGGIVICRGPSVFSNRARWLFQLLACDVILIRKAREKIPPSKNWEYLKYDLEERVTYFRIDMLDVTKRHLACAQTFAEKHEGDGIYIFYTPFYFFPFPLFWIGSYHSAIKKLQTNSSNKTTFVFSIVN